MNILKFIKKVCEENALTYFLSDGTLLGAIRHKGFIPWDDDIDISMSRPDYEKLIGILERGDESPYKIVCMENNKNYCMPFAKVIDNRTILLERTARSVPGMGVYVDIFPLDGLGDDMEEAKKIVKICSKYRLKLQFAQSKKRKLSPKNMLKDIYCKIMWLNRRCIYKRYTKVCRRYTFEKSKYIGFAGAFNGEREILEKDMVSCFLMKPFEDNVYSVPVEFDKYLTQYYGEYMKFPPIEERVSNHSFVAYYKD